MKKTKQMIGKRVLIVGNHPHSGKTGKIIDVDILGLTGNVALRVKCEDGLECYIQYLEKHAQFI